ncbi:MAG: hypothetical protein WKF80_09405 [Thermomicrobiales bacterium]
MSDASLRLAGILMIVIPTIEFGGYSLLRYLTRHQVGYMDNPVRRALFTAGHAHAGVLVILALLALLFVDRANLGDGAKAFVRNAVALAPILVSAGFFLSIVSPTATRPNRLIVLVYAGALSLAAGTVTLGVGLIRAA